MSSLPVPPAALADAPAAPPSLAGFVDFSVTSSRFSISAPASVDAGIAHLREHGYVVLSDVCSDADVATAHDLFWQWAANTYPDRRISRHKWQSWEQLPCVRTGVVWQGGIGHSAFQWHVRSLPGVRAVYEAVWGGEKELVASLDGCGVFRPTVIAAGTKSAQHHPEWITRSAWFHVDQNPRFKPHAECVQGFVSLTEQNEHTGGLVVVPRSHRAFASLRPLVAANNSGDHVNLPPDHDILWARQLLDAVYHDDDDENGSAGPGTSAASGDEPSPKLTTARPILVKCQSGDMVLWDSRVVHCSTPAERDVLYGQHLEALGPKASTADIERLMQQVLLAATRAPAAGAAASSAELKSERRLMEPSLQRLVSYQCLTPASKIAPGAAGDAYRQARLESVQSGVSATHWAHLTPTVRPGAKPSGATYKPIKLHAEQVKLVTGQYSQ